MLQNSTKRSLNNVSYDQDNNHNNNNSTRENSNNQTSGPSFPKAAIVETGKGYCLDFIQSLTDRGCDVYWYSINPFYYPPPEWFTLKRANTSSNSTDNTIQNNIISNDMNSNPPRIIRTERQIEFNLLLIQENPQGNPNGSVYHRKTKISNNKNNNNNDKDNEIDNSSSASSTDDPVILAFDQAVTKLRDVSSHYRKIPNK